MFLLAIAALMLGFGSAYIASDDIRYLTRAGLEETRILQARRPLQRMAADSTIAPAVRAQLGLVLASRDYAARLGLEARRTYTTYADVGRDTLLLVLSAAPRDCICPYTWKYPIVGRMPYKGFFDVGMAKKAAASLDARGYDTSLRPSAAFSTLGWFNDPLLSTALTPDSVELASLVFHEIAHNTLYVKSATPFNESFAQLVGYRAAEQFFRERGDSALARQAAARWHDEIVLGAYYRTLIARLDSFYATRPTGAVLDSGRAEAARWADAELRGSVGGQFESYTVGAGGERPINNARLVGALLYRSHLEWFDRWYHDHGGDVRASVAGLRELMRGADGDAAFARLGRAVGDSSDGAALHPDTTVTRPM